MSRAHFGDAGLTNVFDLNNDDLTADDLMAFFMPYGKILKQSPTSPLD